MNSLFLVTQVVVLVVVQGEGGQEKAFGDENFASTLSGMMGALKKMQEKGDRMIEEVAKQETVLDGVNNQIRTAREVLAELRNITSIKQKEVIELEEKIKDLERDRQLEVGVRMKVVQEKKSVEAIISKMVSEINGLKLDKSHVDKELEALKVDKSDMDRQLKELKVKKFNIDREVKELSEEKLNLKKIVKSLHVVNKELEKEVNNKNVENDSIENNINSMKSELSVLNKELKNASSAKNNSGKMEEVRSELQRVETELQVKNMELEEKQKELGNIHINIEQSSLLLEDIQLSVNNSRNSLEGDLALPPSPSPVPKQEAQVLLPALLLSVLVNLVTGGHILLNNFSTERARDLFLPSVLGGLLPSLQENFKGVPSDKIEARQDKFPNNQNKKQTSPFLQDKLVAPNQNLPQTPVFHQSYGATERQGFGATGWQGYDYGDEDDLDYPLDDLSPGEMDLKQLYSMLADWSGGSAGDNLGDLHLPQPIDGEEMMQDGVITSTEKETFKKTKKEVETRFLSSSSPDTYYNLPKHF